MKIGIIGLGKMGYPLTLNINEIIIIEGLRLKDIEEGIYKLIALPLKIKGVEASPIRAVLIKD